MLILRLLFIILSGALLLFFSIYSYAWFSKSSSVTSSGMQIAVSAEAYDILVDRATTYDSGHEYITGAGNLKSLLSAAGYSLEDEATTDATSIAYELHNEYSFEDHYYMMPGSYGTVSFYLRPKSNNSDVVANFNVSLGGYKYTVVTDEQGNNPVTTMEAVTSTSVLNMLKGHILLFTERTTVNGQYHYDGLVDDETFTFDTHGKSKCQEQGKTDCYKVTLYWEWPITYDTIANNISSSDPAITKKYPEELGDYLANHNEYFFAVNLTSNKAEEMIDAYNDGDQTIGDGMVALVVYISAQ